MLSKEEFKAMREEIESKDKKREEIIALSRDIITLSKQSIYAAHRKDMPTAQSKLSEMKTLVSHLQSIELSLDTNIAQTAYQEYAEAFAYVHFIKSGELATRDQMGLDSESYLLGICDLSGELVRKAVDDVINSDFEGAMKIKEMVTLIYGEFLLFNLRNGELRKKSDQIKWALQKLEDVIYDVKLKGKA